RLSSVTSSMPTPAIRKEKTHSGERLQSRPPDTVGGYVTSTTSVGKSASLDPQGRVFPQAGAPENFSLPIINKDLYSTFRLRRSAVNPALTTFPKSRSGGSVE